MQTKGRPLRHCEISADLARSLGVLDNTCCNLWVGTKSVRVRLAVNPGLGPSTLAVSHGVRRALSIQAGLKTNVTRAGSDLRLGPVVGVFVNPAAAARTARGEAGFRLVELAKANRKAGCILYFFSSADLAWSPPRVNGAYYDQRRNEWRQRSFPLPDVLYDRGGGFKPTERPLARYIRRQLWSVPGLKKFNGRHYFDKWDQHQRLRRHAPLCRHLPETVLYKGSEDLAAMLAKHGCVYLKSTLGSNGRGVMRVIAGENGYKYNHCRTEVEAGFCPDLASLETVIRGFLGRQKAVIQAGIDLLTYNGAKIDLRVLAARDARGLWRIVDTPVRVARGDCAVTSTRLGSTVHRFGEFFRTALLYDEARLWKLRKRILKTVYLAIRAIEDEYGDFGELGLDLGIDKQGKIWFIEANAKPGKDTIRLAGDPAALEKAFLFPLQYCRRLAGFADTEGCVNTVRIRRLKTSVPLKKRAGSKLRPIGHGGKVPAFARRRKLRVPAPAVVLPPPDYRAMTTGIPIPSGHPGHGAGPKGPVPWPAPVVTHACFSPWKTAAITRPNQGIGAGSMTPTCSTSPVVVYCGPHWTGQPVWPACTLIRYVGSGTKAFARPCNETVADAEG